MKKEDPQSKYLEKFDISSLQNLFLAGERCDPDTIQWISGAFAKAIPHRPPHVIDHWWQTKTGWPITSLCVGITSQPRKAPSHGIANSIKAKFGSAGMPVPGYDVRVLDSETAKDLKHSTIGEIAIKLPLPPGTLMGLWNDEEGLVNSYLKRFPGYFNSGDAGFMDADGYVHIMSRVDDIINVSGHRLSTGAMEEVLSKHDSVAECAVIAIKDALKGEVPIGLVVLKNGTKKSGNQIISELKSMIRNEIGPIACFNEAFIVSKLPKTRSGKVLRAVLRKIANGESYTNPPTIEDMSALSEAHKALDPLRAKL
jgi:propionyl-CoA synthetase